MTISADADDRSSFVNADSSGSLFLHLNRMTLSIPRSIFETNFNKVYKRVEIDFGLALRAFKSISGFWTIFLRNTTKKPCHNYRFIHHYQHKYRSKLIIQRRRNSFKTITTATTTKSRVDLMAAALLLTTSEQTTSFFSQSLKTALDIEIIRVETRTVHDSHKHHF
ncbi:hypothetical protein T02_9642 [Trichinella nativa]|uniref:Uncharacterized protein n=1 Tax=Trichinella nativa TaxID=6335 RepID=A0A0V1LKD7_9BILA|nr:hypothetical protein T02_9642 [Trichinella nativa]